ncbi:MAG: plastocyanin/azurin family copper-binding protein [Balneolaceae bacterium]|nr:plastocyanin/azurin family copper-binding protein [Balneolaceae bacterium]
MLVVLVGCGGQSGDQQQTEQQTEETTDDGVRTIRMIGIDALKFGVESNAEGITVGENIGKNNDLLRLETITVEPGEEITIELYTRSNLPASAMAHNWVLLALDADVEAFANAAIQAKENDYIPQDMTDQVIAQTGLAAGDQTETITFTAPEEPGTYEYICTFPGHYASGMKGEFIVKEPES